MNSLQLLLICISVLSVSATAEFLYDRNINDPINFVDPETEFVRSAPPDLYRETKKLTRREAEEVLDDDDDDDGEEWVVMDSKDEEKEKRKEEERKEKRKEEERREKEKEKEKKETLVNPGSGESDVSKAGDVSAVPANKDEFSDIYFLIIVTVCGVAGCLALIVAVLCVCRAKHKDVEKPGIDYGTWPTHSVKTVPSLGNYAGSDPAYGLYPAGGYQSGNEGALALSAQKFHFQHEKEKIIAMEKERNSTEPPMGTSQDNEEIYETAGLAPMWDVEVSCPLYTEEVTPSPSPRGNTPVDGLGSTTPRGTTPVARANANGYKSPKDRRSPNVENNNNNNDEEEDDENGNEKLGRVNGHLSDHDVK